MQQQAVPREGPGFVCCLSRGSSARSGSGWALIRVGIEPSLPCTLCSAAPGIKEVNDCIKGHLEEGWAGKRDLSLSRDRGIGGSWG